VIFADDLADMIVSRATSLHERTELPKDVVVADNLVGERSTFYSTSAHPFSLREGRRCGDQICHSGPLPLWRINCARTSHTSPERLLYDKFMVPVIIFG